MREELALAPRQRTGEGAERASEAVRRSYDAGVMDEFIEPWVIGDPSVRRIRPGDVVVIWNFRPDRARQITQALGDPSFDGFDRAGQPPLPSITTMTRLALALGDTQLVLHSRDGAGNEASYSKMGGYQLMVSNEGFRGRYRTSFEKPEPIRPDGDPLVWREMSWYGAHIAYKEEEAGLSGVINMAIYSGWGHFGFHWITPFHNIAGMLTESASARLASPLYIHPDQLRGGSRGLLCSCRPRRRSSWRWRSSGDGLPGAVPRPPPGASITGRGAGASRGNPERVPRADLARGFLILFLNLFYARAREGSREALRCNGFQRFALSAIPTFSGFIPTFSGLVLHFPG